MLEPWSTPQGAANGRESTNASNSQFQILRERIRHQGAAIRRIKNQILRRGDPLGEPAVVERAAASPRQHQNGPRLRVRRGRSGRRCGALRRRPQGRRPVPGARGHGRRIQETVHAALSGHRQRGRPLATQVVDHRRGRRAVGGLPAERLVDEAVVVGGGRRRRQRRSHHQLHLQGVQKQIGVEGEVLAEER